uniref:Secreted peptide n=1 Tax=Cacopsylla melanoneura TaxID=428564 RepID=A0A8D9B3N5_9HEMI
MCVLCVLLGCVFSISFMTPFCALRCFIRFCSTCLSCPSSFRYFSKSSISKVSPKSNNFGVPLTFFFLFSFRVAFGLLVVVVRLVFGFIVSRRDAIPLLYRAFTSHTTFWRYFNATFTK